MNAPRYPLEAVKALVEEDRVMVTRAALRSALSLRMDVDDIRDCILALEMSHFDKTMEAEKAPGLWQDVYRVRFLGVSIYLKLQIVQDGTVRVISFKQGR